MEVVNSIFKAKKSAYSFSGRTISVIPIAFRIVECRSEIEQATIRLAPFSFNVATAITEAPMSFRMATKIISASFNGRVLIASRLLMFRLIVFLMLFWYSFILSISLSIPKTSCPRSVSRCASAIPKLLSPMMMQFICIGFSYKLKNDSFFGITVGL